MKSETIATTAEEVRSIHTSFADLFTIENEKHRDTLQWASLFLEDYAVLLEQLDRDCYGNIIIPTVPYYKAVIEMQRNLINKLPHLGDGSIAMLGREVWEVGRYEKHRIRKRTIDALYEHDFGYKGSLGSMVAYDRAFHTLAAAEAARDELKGGER